MNIDKIVIKMGWDDPSEELLTEMMGCLNDEYLSVYGKLSEPIIDGKYLTIKYEYCDSWAGSLEFISGMVAGYLMANGIDII